jgi:phosphoribosylamine---glycine ligase
MSVSVVLASKGYPGSYERDKEILGLKKAESVDKVLIFHAGTVKRTGQDGPRYFTSGGRVLNITALGGSIREAKERAYDTIRLIDFENIYYRKDISDKALVKEV